MADKKYFPIKTATACQLKWNWSTIHLNSGISLSCHRTAQSELTAYNFNEFHNTPLKLADRASMLRGEWPEQSCSYCRDIEEFGGVSDRIRHLTIPDAVPVELDDNNTSLIVSPTIVEVYFTNACNLGCLYCRAEFSSSIDAENIKFGSFKKSGDEITSVDHHFKDLIPYFWEWFPIGFPKIKRFHALGGEPLLQKEFDKLLDMIEQYPNPDCELNIITNLMIPPKRLENFIKRFKHLIITKKLRRVDITCSIDCWGPQQEYVRWGIDLIKWEENFKTLLKHKWLIININQTISPLTIKTMPDLLIKLSEWRKEHKIGHWFGGVYPGPSYLKAEIFGGAEFAPELAEILSLMPQENDEDITAHNYMMGLFTQIESSQINFGEIINLIIYLDEKDRRRNTNWQELFPWLVEYKKYVV